jgi:S1-C subfamily serine protease
MFTNRLELQAAPEARQQRCWKLGRCPAWLPSNSSRSARFTTRRVDADGCTPTGVIVTDISPDGPASEAGLSAGAVIVQIQQENVAAVEDVARLIAFARQRQRRHVAVLVFSTKGLRWLAMSLQ